MTAARSAPPVPAGGGVRIRVPATSANLGPGFDAFGLALSLHDEIVVRVTEGGLVVDVQGQGAERLPRGERNLLVRATRAGLAELEASARGLHFACANAIPQRRGLGSSAAATVAGLLAARALVPDGAERLDDTRLLELATELEGHPDNAAACLAGGLTIAWSDRDRPRFVRLQHSRRLRPLVCVPRRGWSTSAARRLLPATVPHPEAARNAGRAALLVHALTVAPELLLPATEDWLHQPYRATAVPASARLIARLRDFGLPAVLSGAGPAVLVVQVAGDRHRVGELAGPRWEVRPVAVDGGARVTPFRRPGPGRTGAAISR